ncbi:hypothetical protein [Prosthecobacter sp.]|uniref:hypothetical protein n=1 Tax=Prosthecobacter sp. TaxID=1965333 RepID=UPI001E149F0E|nr:hypothetical protein [Prosthecobacter sp.]MCB1277243.1 hypothetical protein [Prosthecobacter sp.]
MAKHGQQQQETSANEKQSSCGGRQAVVELCEITSCGLVFWSRQRFEIGAEVQMRIKRSALPPEMLAMAGAKSKWVMLRGLVVACPPRRRTDGSHGFEVSLLVDQSSGSRLQSPKVHSKMKWFTPRWRGLRRFGLN